MMTETELLNVAYRLEERIQKSGPNGRLALQPELGSLLTQLQTRGVAVPARLRSLNALLIDEEVEARFDNMPV